MGESCEDKLLKEKDQHDVSSPLGQNLHPHGRPILGSFHFTHHTFPNRFHFAVNVYAFQNQRNEACFKTHPDPHAFLLLLCDLCPEQVAGARRPWWTPGRQGPTLQSLTLFFFFKGFLFVCLFKFYLFIFGCVGSSFLCEGFLQLRRAGATLHHGARASHYRGLSCCGAQAPDAQAQ